MAGDRLRHHRGAMSATGEGRALAGNAAWMVGANVVSKLASFVLVVVLARGLGPRQYGYFAFALAFVPLFLQLARWGIDVVTVRQVAADRTALSRVFVNGLAARVALALGAALAAAALSIFFVDGKGPLLAVSIVAAALFLDELSTFLGGVFIAFERMRFNAMVLVVNRFASTLLAVVVVALGGGLALVCLTYFLGSLGALACGWVAFGRFFPPVDRRDYRREDVGRLLREGGPYGVAAFLNFGVFRVDTVLLQALKGPAAVGMYGVAYRFFEPLLFATWSLGEAALPRFVREHEEGLERRTFEHCLAFLLAFHLPIAVAAPFTARWVVTLVFGSEYSPAVPAVMWLTSAACLYAVAHLARMASVAVGRRTELTWVAAGVLALNVVANLAVIPRHGFVGAAAVTFATEALEASLLVGLCLTKRRRLDLRPLLVPVLAATVMGAVLLALDWRGLAAAVVGSLAFALALGVAGLVLLPAETRRLLRRRRPFRPPVPAATAVMDPDEGPDPAEP